MRKACSALILVALACRGDAPPPVRDSARAAGPRQAPADSTIARASGWDERAGPVLLVAGESPSEALVIYPQLQGEEGPDTVDATDYSGRRASLVARHGPAGAVTLGEPIADVDDAACIPWPRLSTPADVPAWTVGFVNPSVDAVPVDSLHAMATRDSSRFVAEIARLASTLAGSRRSDAMERFHGLPFVVKDAGILRHGDTDVAVAHVVRRVNQEANPLEEHTLLVLERRASGGPWAIRYTDQAVGPEDTVVRAELLAVVRLGGQLSLVLALDGGEGVRYALVQRAGDGRWRQVWRSAQPGC